MYNLWKDSTTIPNTRLTTVGWTEQANPSFTYLKDLVANLKTHLAKVLQENVITAAQFGLIKDKQFI